jgi:hypothetical protein
MAASGGVPARVCPHCARIAYASEDRCPYCGRGYRRHPLLGVAALLLVTALVVLGGVAAMFLAFATELQDQLDAQVSRVQRDLDRNLGDLQRQVRDELQRRLPGSTFP